MPNADKCYLNISYKDTARANLTFDDEGMLQREGLERFNSEMFENFKEIERRINDPACGDCACVAGRWYMDQVSLQFSITDNSVFDLTEDFATGIGFASTGSGTQAIEVPSDGVYHIVTRVYHVLGATDPSTTVITAELFNFGDGGTDGDLISDWGILYPGSEETYGYFKSATIARLDAGATITPYTRMLANPSMTAGDEILVGGSGVGASQISVTKICGC